MAFWWHQNCSVPGQARFLSRDPLGKEKRSDFPNEYLQLTVLTAAWFTPNLNEIGKIADKSEIMHPLSQGTNQLVGQKLTSGVSDFLKVDDPVKRIKPHSERVNHYYALQKSLTHRLDSNKHFKASEKALTHS